MISRMLWLGSNYKGPLVLYLHPTLHPVQWNFKTLWNILSKQSMFLYISLLKSTILEGKPTTNVSILGSGGERRERKDLLIYVPKKLQS